MPEEINMVVKIVEMITANWSFWRWFFIAMAFNYFGQGFFKIAKGGYVIVMYFRKKF